MYKSREELRATTVTTFWAREVRPKMRHTRFHVVLIAVRFSLLSGVFFVFPSLNKSQNTPPPGYVTPILRLEKPKYLLGEAIRFWVGVEPKNSSPIPQEAWKPCSLEITKPDGSIETQ